MHARWIVIGGGFVAAFAVGACSHDQGSAGPSPPMASTSAPSQSVGASTSNPYGPPPTNAPGPNEPVLTVKGGTAPLSLTIDELNALGSAIITVNEPFVKKRQSFGGVPLAVVLAKAGIPVTATIDTVGLDDYHYAGPVQNMIGSDALIATSRDGAPIPAAEGGPIRLVFPDDTPLSSDVDAWNWSLAAINATG